MALAPGSKLGPYEIVAPIGAGGMGEVYRAKDARLGREVALKVLPEEVSEEPDRLSRFEKEARAASALNHPNIITIYEVGKSDSTAFIAMELVEGKTLRELCVSGPMPIRRILALAAQAADGLAKAHSAEIVHRDLKPENLMVTRDGFVKILDFGLAKLVPAGFEDSRGTASPTVTRGTEAGTVLGTVGYMSPEQASGEPLDFRSDQFSFGSILYEMATGTRAFEKRTAAQTLSAIIQDEPEPLSRLRPEVPPPLRWIVERCMAKEPEERYASTRDLARDLGSVRDHISEVSSGAEALLAPPVASRRRLVPVLWAAGLVLLVALAGALLLPGLRGKAPASAPSFHRLTFRSGLIGNARFAPDGQTILYSALWEGEPGRLYLTRAQSPESSTFDFGKDDADILAVSPLGEMAILLNMNTEGEQGVLARVPMAGGVPRQVLEGVSYAGADWAPNGKDLVVVHKIGGKARLEFPIGNVILAEPVNCPRFSPRGDRIAFIGDNDTSVTVIDSAGKAKKVLSSGWAYVDGGPSWRPDGKELWFTAQQAGQSRALYAVDLSGKRRLVARVPGNLELDDISRDGRVLAAHHTVVTILRGLAQGEEKERNLSWLDASIPADLSPDGKTLVLTESGEGSGAAPSVYLRKTDGSAAVRLGEGTGLALSPDGRWVLANVHPDGGMSAQLVVLPTGAGETRTLKGQGGLVYGGAAWLPDGKRIVFAAEGKDHGRHIYLQNLEGGEARQVTSDTAWIRPSTSPVSPDGKVVFGIQEDGKAALYPIEGGQARPVAGLEPGEFPVRWSADGLSLYVRQQGGIPHKVWLLDPASGQRHLWLEIKPQESGLRAFIPQLLMSRDGKSYVYGSDRVTSELYLVEGLR